VQFGIAAGQINAIHRRQFGIGQRREERQFRAQRLQGVEIGRVEEGERRVAGDADAHAFEQGRRRFRQPVPRSPGSLPLRESQDETAGAW
jgi:hypothetical protein